MALINVIPVVCRETDIDDSTFPTDMAVRVLESVITVYDTAEVSRDGKEEVSMVKSDSFSTIFKSNVVMNDDGLWY